jgi:hypothetical protein
MRTRALVTLLAAAAVATPPPPVRAAGAPQATAAPDALYVCVTEARGRREQAAIVFPPNVEPLCRAHPEMGPCRYERNRCRATGGRVFAAGGTEITAATEAEYDRKVLRARLRAN